MSDEKPDMVHRPPHYRAHPSGVECIELARWLPFALGNALKYVWRAEHKDAPTQDMEKALWYVRDARAQVPAHDPSAATLAVLAEVLEAEVEAWRREVLACLVMAGARNLGRAAEILEAQIAHRKGGA